MNKPTKPSETLPASFGGVKENFSSSKITSGYQKNIRDILGGANLNYLLDTLGKKDAYHDAISDYINALPVNKTIVTNANNNLVYTQYDIRVYDATETYFKEDYVTGWDNNEKFIYKSLVDNNIGHPVTDTNYWIRTGIIGNGHSRNVGELVHSLIPLQDAGLHLLDGALLQGNGAYSEFVSHMASLYGDGTNIPKYFTNESDWQQSVSSYGVCGKFVYNSTNNTLRLPKITGIIEGTIDETALGDLVQAGLPNITGKIDASNQGINAESFGETYAQITGVFEGIYGYQSATADASVGSTMLRGFNFDASRSNSIYGRSNTVQPQTVKGFVYIVVANIAKTNIEVDIDEIATDLNGKLDTDLTNMAASQSAKNTIMSWVMPDYANGVTKTPNTTYTADVDGYIQVYAEGGDVSNVYAIVEINGVSYGVGHSNSGYTGYYSTMLFRPVAKGSTYKVTAGQGWFIPLKGAN